MTLDVSEPFEDSIPEMMSGRISVYTCPNRPACRTTWRTTGPTPRPSLPDPVQVNVMDIEIVTGLREYEIDPDLQHRDLRGHFDDSKVPAVLREDLPQFPPPDRREIDMRNTSTYGTPASSSRYVATYRLGRRPRTRPGTCADVTNSPVPMSTTSTTLR